MRYAESICDNKICNETEGFYHLKKSRNKTLQVLINLKFFYWNSVFDGINKISYFCGISKRVFSLDDKANNRI